MSVLLIWKYLAVRKKKEITNSTHQSGLRQSAPSRRPIAELLSKYNITLVNSEHDCERFLSEKVPRAPVIIGLDCEWVNREGMNSAPVALLQLSFPSGQCLLARVFRMTALGPRLTDLLTDRRSLSLSLSYTHIKHISL